MHKVFNYGYRKEEPEKYAKALREIHFLCSCGHTIMIPVQDQYKVCSYCGKKNLNTTKARFKYMLRKKMKQSEKNNN